MKEKILKNMKGCYGSNILLAKKIGVTATEVDEFFNDPNNIEIYVEFMKENTNLTTKALISLESLVEEGNFNAIKFWLKANAKELGFGNSVEVAVSAPKLSISFEN
jgi:hypothetical protein